MAGSQQSGAKRLLAHLQLGLAANCFHIAASDSAGGVILLQGEFDISHFKIIWLELIEG